MAKAKQVPDAASSADLYEWAAEVLRLRFDEVVSFGNAALVPWNVKAVHDIRVAIRRFRSAMRHFVEAINEKPLKKVKRDLKKIADALGMVRDRDVAVVALEELALEAEKESIRKGIEALINDFRIGRERAYARLQKTLAPETLDDLRDGFSATIENTLRQHELFSPSDLSEAARGVIEAHLRDLGEHGSAIYDPSDGPRLHALRIAAKRLRYAIELFEQCWGDEIAGFAKELATMQSYLGNVHDRDAWTEILADHVKYKRNRKDRNVMAAAAWLSSKFAEKRATEYRSALELWSEWKDNGFVERLRVVISQE